MRFHIPAPVAAPSIAALRARNQRLAASLAASEALAARRARYYAPLTGCGIPNGRFITTDRPHNVTAPNAGRDTVLALGAD